MQTKSRALFGSLREEPKSRRNRSVRISWPGPPGLALRLTGCCAAGISTLWLHPSLPSFLSFHSVLSVCFSLVSHYSSFSNPCGRYASSAPGLLNSVRHYLLSLRLDSRTTFLFAGPLSSLLLSCARASRVPQRLAQLDSTYIHTPYRGIVTFEPFSVLYNSSRNQCPRRLALPNIKTASTEILVGGKT